MQHVVANRTRWTCLWSLILGVIRVTPGHTKSTVHVVTTLFSPAVNSCLAVPRLTIIRWDSSYSLNFRRSVFRCSSTWQRERDMWERARRHSATGFRELHRKSFHKNFCFIWERNPVISFLNLASRIFATTKPFDIFWYLSYISLTNMHCSKADINNINWNSFLTFAQILFSILFANANYTS